MHFFSFFFLLAVFFNPLSANFTKWSNTLKQFVGNLPTNCLRVFDHFVGLALKGLIIMVIVIKSITQKQHFNEIALRHGCSPENLLHIFRTGGLLLLYLGKFILYTGKHA